jgi:branched-chain amino acid transport system ATP-binding protein
MTPPPPLVELRGIEVEAGGRTILQVPHLILAARGTTAVLGANGAGKTTTLKAISGVLRTVGGRVLFDGEDITHASARRVLDLGIAHCPEGRHVFPYMTVRENLEMGCYLRRDKAGIEADLERLFERFPILSERRYQAAGTLSGGEQQMLAISRALMSRPKLVLFDEPSLGLAPNIVERTFDIIAQIRAEGVTVMMVEQNALAALELSDRCYVMEQGRVTRTGSGQALLNDPEVKKAYLGG